MTAISSKNSITQNWQIAVGNDGVVTKGEADQILSAARKSYISGKEKRQAEDILRSVQSKVQSLMESDRAANGAALDNHPYAEGLRAEVESRTEQQRQNLEMAQHIAGAVSKERASQNFVQNIWSWFFSS